MDKTFYSTIAGAFIALLGVLVTLRANHKTFEANLREEREKVARDREYSAKHKAFLAASEAVSRFVLLYIALPDRDLPKNGAPIEEVTAIDSVINALHFFCGVEAIRRTTALSQTLSTSFSEAIKLKLPAMFLDEDIKGLDIRITGLEKSNEVLQQEILVMLGADPANRLLVSHRQQVAENYEKISAFHAQKGELFKQKFAATEKCRDATMKNLPRVYEGLREVLLIARQELGFPIDAEEYSKLIAEATAAAQTSVKSLLQEVREQVLLKIQ